MGRTQQPELVRCGFGQSRRDHRKVGEGSARYHDWPGSKYDKLGHGAHSTGGITLSIIYALIVRGDTIVAECQAGKDHFSQATKAILFGKTLNNGQSPLVWEQFLVHYISEGGFTFLVVANDSVDQGVPIAFLKALHQELTSLTSSSILLPSLPAHELQLTFYPTISSLMNTYNTVAQKDNTKVQKGLATARYITYKAWKISRAAGDHIRTMVRWVVRKPR